MNRTELEVWQRPERRTYFQPSHTTYYETTRRENRGQGGAVTRALGAVIANGILGWAAWSAHQACLNGNAHSVAAEVVISAAAGGTAVLAGTGFLSRTEAGSWAGTLLSPVALVLGGFGALLWAPKWPASMTATLMFGALNGGIAAVITKLKREVRQSDHEAGMQYDRIVGDLQMNADTQDAKTDRARIKHQAWFRAGHYADRGPARVEYQLHLRYPETFPAPEGYPGPDASRELPAARQPLAITSGVEHVDDWMALADALDEHVETR